MSRGAVVHTLGFLLWACAFSLAQPAHHDGVASVDVMAHSGSGKLHPCLHAVVATEGIWGCHAWTARYQRIVPGQDSLLQRGGTRSPNPPRFVRRRTGVTDSVRSKIAEAAVPAHRQSASFRITSSLPLLRPPVSGLPSEPGVHPFSPRPPDSGSGVATA